MLVDIKGSHLDTITLLTSHLTQRTTVPSKQKYQYEKYTIVFIYLYFNIDVNRV